MTATLVDTDVLTDLDFMPALPCELGAHDIKCPGNLPAAWRVFGNCPGCHRRVDFLVCEPGRRRKVEDWTGCESCGHCHSWRDAYTVIPIEGP